jgi:hypothetical protein
VLKDSGGMKKGLSVMEQQKNQTIQFDQFDL